MLEVGTSGGNLNCRGNSDYELSAEAGYVCDEALATAAVLRPEI
jgi:hypothetical protein